MEQCLRKSHINVSPWLPLGRCLGLGRAEWRWDRVGEVACTVQNFCRNKVLYYMCHSLFYFYTK